MWWRKWRWKKVKRCVLLVTMLILLLLFYIDNDKSFWPIPNHGIISQTENPYVQMFPDRQFGSSKSQKTILLWTTYFQTYEWLETIPKHATHCNLQCIVTNDRRKLLQSDAILFHFTDKDLFKHDLPTKRLPHQVWAIYINEPNVFVQESFTRWKDVFNWTVSYRRHSTVFTPYGKFETGDSVLNASVYLSHARDKMAYAIISRCADDAERYRLVHEISKYINVDYFGECGNLKCEIEHNSCLSSEHIKRYRFRLAFEDSNCRDYVTEKYWDTLLRGVIPVVNWKEAQRDVPVPPNSYINVYDFKDIKSLADYLLKVSTDSALFNSYFDWRRHYKIYTSFWDSFCNICTALNNRTIPAQVYTDLEGWIRDDYCPRFTVSISDHAPLGRGTRYPHFWYPCLMETLWTLVIFGLTSDINYWDMLFKRLRPTPLSLADEKRLKLEKGWYQKWRDTLCQTPVILKELSVVEVL